MTTNNSFSTGSIIEALSRICIGKLSGELSFPFRDIIAHLFFESGSFKAFDPVMGKKYLVPFLEQSGVEVGAISGERISLFEVRQSGDVLEKIQEFFVDIIKEILDPSLSVIINFDEKKDLTELASIDGLSVAGVILTFYERWLEQERIPSFAPPPDKVIHVSSDAMEVGRFLPLTTRQAFILTRLMDGMKVRDLILSSGLGDEIVLRALLAFEALGIVRVGGVKKKASGKEHFHGEEPTLEGKETSLGYSSTAPTKQEAKTSAEELAVIPQELLIEIEDYEIIAQKGDYYGLLDLDPRSESSEIKKQFSSMAKKFHPDKFNKYKDPEIQKRVNNLFEKITKAYEILKDPKSRSKYDAEIGLSRVTPEATEKKAKNKQKSGKYAYEDAEHRAKQHFLHGKEAFRRKHFHDAVEHFREAVRLHPEVPEYQFMLGKILSKNPQKAREAEERLKKALEGKPDRIEFILELANFYRNNNLPLRAKKYFEKVLELDPENKEARQALGLKQRKKISFKDLLKMDLKDLLNKDKDE